VRPETVVVQAPGFDLLLRVVQAHEHVFVKAFVAELAVEALDVAVLVRLPGLNFT